MRLKVFFYKNAHPTRLVALLFLLFVAIRLPQLSRPLSKHHELNVAAVLISIDAWNKHGLGISNGVPLHMYPGKFNILKDAATPYPRLIASGTYMSMGAGSYLLPWLVFKILHIAPTAYAIRIFNLLFQFISLLLLLRLMQYLLQKLANTNRPIGQTNCITALVFLSCPGILWFMGNAYCHEILVLPFYMAALLVAFKIRDNWYAYHAKHYLAYTLLIAAAVYIDWLGVITAFVCSIAAFSIKNGKQRLLFLGANLVAVGIPIAIIFWQNISTVGLQEYRHFFAEQLFNRRLPNGQISYSILDYLKHLASGFGLWCVAACIGLVLLKKRLQPSFLLLIAIPALHYFLFKGFSNQHDYAVLKWLPVFVFLSVVCIQSLAGLHKKKQWIIAAIGALANLGIYQYINPPLSKSWSGEQYNWMKNVGEKIPAIAQPNEFVFINTPSYYYQISWYARRNYKNVKDTTEAKIWLKNQPEKKAVYILLNENNLVENSFHLYQH